ncbi:Peptide chain release factor 1-like, mitochondrial [Habropoda laboriosa]|uniref:Peptide chain release factor 1-like, mitochondrial n=1 Tax=Habropoda laboriosa TaxID=597456 RepID=A0A0L7R1Q0_9HYME|nr:PREDICTED: peptide chain release factor 1 [Habropoda laboriosa]KOC64768.1 Peptide chain release factor 1-like, mitochondrial [Habropoda laboriosa]
MLFLIKGCTFSACRYYGNIISRAKLLESWCQLFPNLNRKLPSINKLFSTEKNLFVINANVQRYLNNLMNAYQSEDEIKGTISEIFKLHNISLLLDKKIKIIENLKNLSDLISGNEEMKDLAKEEESLYKQQLLEVDEKIINIILQHLGGGYYDNVIMEVVPGVGGQEAMIFVQDLFNMYIGYLDYLGFTYEIMELLECEPNGLRKASLLISDSKAFEKLQYESGVHRVQRVPATEKSGRLHTSTAVVTIIPEPKDVEIQLEEKDLKIEAKKASGPGGQHVNSTNSAIRITHLPTGKVVTCHTDRSQIKNKKLALMKLKSLLYEEQMNEHDSIISEMRKKQMGSKLRNEKIRTYNFNQDRVTDHRISNGTMHNLKDFMRDGVGLEELEDRLNKDMSQKTLLEIIEKTDSQLK